MWDATPSVALSDPERSEGESKCGMRGVVRMNVITE
jgi:hypothetical protein